MLVTILAEPRTGTQSLHYWIKKFSKKYRSVFEPFNALSEDYKARPAYDMSWMNDDVSYIVHEKYFPEKIDIEKIVSLSDMTICIRREDVRSQIESYVHAVESGLWRGKYVENLSLIDNIDSLFAKERDYFLMLKSEFNAFIDLHNIKTFSYEDLYFNGKIKDLVDYIDLDVCEDFPYGERYRTERQNKIRLI